MKLEEGVRETKCYMPEGPLLLLDSDSIVDGGAWRRMVFAMSVASKEKRERMRDRGEIRESERVRIEAENENRKMNMECACE